MRLYNEVEETSKVVVVEDYKTFNDLLKSKWLFYLLIAYTAFAVINGVLSIIDGGYFMGALNVIIHGLVCASLWIFRSANLNNQEEKFSTKGTKMFQITHAVKYIIVFILIVLLVILVLFAWIDAANVAKKAYVDAMSQTDKAIIAQAKANKAIVFWKYLGILVLSLSFAVATCVYYKAVMCAADGMVKYHEKGKHFWNDIKFLAIYLFVTAGLNIVLGLLSALGLFDSIFKSILDTNFAVVFGGLGWLSFVGRVLFAGLCICFGICSLNAYKILSTTETSHEEVKEITE